MGRKKLLGGSSTRRKRKIGWKQGRICCQICVIIIFTLYIYSIHKIILTHHEDGDKHKPSNPRVANSHLYLRYDEAGIQAIPGTARSHHLPFAIPASRTIPRHLVEDKAYHLSQRRNTTSKSLEGKDYRASHDYSKDHRTLYLYNPHILPLHNTIDISDTSKSDPDFLSRSDLHTLTGGDPSVRYLVTYRAFLGCNCFGIDPERKIMKAGERISYLAIALLDDHLDVINGTDVLIDFNLIPPFGDGNRYKKQFREDCRTFLIRGDIQILCNSHIQRVRIRRTVGRDGMAIPDDPVNNGIGDEFRFENIYGDGLEITLPHMSKKLVGGKNLNIFRSPVLPSDTDTVIENKEYSYNYFVQTFPIPHSYCRLANIHKHGKYMGCDNKIEYGPMASLPSPSFDTPDITATRSILNLKDDTIDLSVDMPLIKQPERYQEVPFFHGSVDHGTACCVPMSLEGSQVMVGISHTKFSIKDPFWMNDQYKRYNHFIHDQFLSSFIAYDIKPPFNIVARSGLFCLGFANKDEGRSEINGSSFAGRNTQHRLELFNETFNCPQIHFASAFAEVVGDQSKAIIGYGINDCHPRMMIVEKEDITNRLLGRI